MYHSELEKKAMQDELASLNVMLAQYIDGKPYEGKTQRLEQSDIDRQAAEQKKLEEVNKADLDNIPAAAIGADYGLFQEDQRIRRDAVIARQGHKRLMQGCLETAWRRKLKLEKELEIEHA